MVTHTHYDLIAIGGGSGGLAVARRAASYGARCAVIEPARLGGTCVNVGCVPKKLMWYAADVAEKIAAGSGYGFNVEHTFDWTALCAQRDAYVRRLNGIYESSLKQANVDHIVGYGRFLDAQHIAVGEHTFSAEHLVIATGGRPIVPAIPGAELGMTSDGFFAMKQQPRRVAIVGSGYIAAELASLLSALGSHVTLVLRDNTLLTRFDVLLRETLMDALLQDGVSIEANVALRAVAESDDGTVRLYREDGETVGGFDCLIWAVGRAPNALDLDLARCGVHSDAHGFVVTDAFQNTNIAGIYAVGDVTGRAALTPVAIAAGRRLADRVFGGQEHSHLAYDLIPTVVFTHPPLATVGLTEDEARERHGDDVKIYQSRFTPLYYAPLHKKQRTAIKLVTVGPAEHIAGCHIAGLGADEILQGFAVAIRMGATKEDLDNTLAIHPTVAEELVTLR
jgi:glutathione reductase (NADPH)